MTFYYQRQCEDSCYSPCSYSSVYSYRSSDCGSPCGWQSSGGLCGYRDCCPSYSPRYCAPSSARWYTQRYSCYPCSYPCSYPC